MAEMGEAEMEIDSSLFDEDRRAVEAECPCCESETPDIDLHLRFFKNCGNFHLMKKALEATKVELKEEREKFAREQVMLAKSSKFIAQRHKKREMELQGLLDKAKEDLESQMLSHKKREMELQELLDKAEKDLEAARREKAKAAKAKKKKKRASSSSSESEDGEQRKKTKTREKKKLRAATRKKVKQLSFLYFWINTVDIKSWIMIWTMIVL